MLDQQFYIPAHPRTPAPVHALFGTAHALFGVISDISQLGAHARFRYSSASANARFELMAADLELQLQAWVPAPCSSVTSDPDLTRKIAAAGIMLQWATLMRLHLITTEGDMTHPKVRVAVQNILAALNTIPEGDMVESMLIFPIFAAGFGAINQAEREYVDRRFAIMERTIGFGNVFDARQAVRKHWERVDGGWDRGWESVVTADHDMPILMS